MVELEMWDNIIVFRKKAYNNVMRLRGLLGRESNDRKYGKIEGGFE